MQKMTKTDHFQSFLVIFGPLKITLGNTEKLLDFQMFYTMFIFCKEKFEVTFHFQSKKTCYKMQKMSKMIIFIHFLPFSGI